MVIRHVYQALLKVGLEGLDLQNWYRRPPFIGAGIPQSRRQNFGPWENHTSKFCWRF